MPTISTVLASRRSAWALGAALLAACASSTTLPVGGEGGNSGDSLPGADTATGGDSSGPAIDSSGPSADRAPAADRGFTADSRVADRSRTADTLRRADSLRSGDTLRSVDAGPPPALSLRVVGNTLVDGSGKVIHLRGVNRSGTEYACIQGWGIFDGPSDAASVATIAGWHARSVRVLLNEDCWLGINGVMTAYGGANYRTAIVDYVNLLHSYGMYAEISLIWAAPGTTQATDQSDMPDQDHSIALWQSVATTFKSDPAVIFGAYGEPHNVTYSCWLSGGSACSTGYAVAGMQAIVNAIRGTGATQPIAVPGIDYANNMTGWLANEPVDPLHSLVAEAHIYGGQTCSTTSCFDTQLLPVAAKVPMLWGETGEDYTGGDCGSSNITAFLPWADANGISYQAWTWDTWGCCLALISDYSGTVNSASAYASYVKTHLAALAGTP